MGRGRVNAAGSDICEGQEKDFICLHLISIVQKNLGGLSICTECSTPGVNGRFFLNSPILVNHLDGGKLLTV